MRLTQPVRSVLKARTLKGLLEEIAEGKERDEKVMTLAVDCLDASCVGDLEEDEMWSVLIKLLKALAREGKLYTLFLMRDETDLGTWYRCSKRPS